MRGTVPDLHSAHPLGETLPGLYRDDAFTQSLCAALDTVLAPVLSVLDNLPAYLDLAMAPEDLLQWLAQWVGIPLDAELPGTRQRELLRAAANMQGWQGTARGIELAVEALLGIDVEVHETGGAAWSSDPAAALPGTPGAQVLVRVNAPADVVIDPKLIEAVVAAVIPAHVPHRVELRQ